MSIQYIIYMVCQSSIFCALLLMNVKTLFFRYKNELVSKGTQSRIDDGKNYTEELKKLD